MLVCVLLCARDDDAHLHTMCGPQNENKMAPQWRDWVTDVWAKVRHCSVVGGATF